jgi:hypothetical protein
VSFESQQEKHEASFQPLNGDEQSTSSGSKLFEDSYSSIGAQDKCTQGAQQHLFCWEGSGKLDLYKWDGNDSSKKIPDRSRIFSLDEAPLELNLINWGDDIRNDDLKQVGSFVSVINLSIASRNVTDAGIGHLRNMLDLQRLDLSDTRVTDRSLEVIKGFKGLQELYLINTGISDEGLKSIAEMKSLKRLILPNFNLTEEGLDQLKKMKSLQYLNLSQCGGADLTVSQFRELKRALPNCFIAAPDGLRYDAAARMQDRQARKGKENDANGLDISGDKEKISSLAHRLEQLTTKSEDNSSENEKKVITNQVVDILMPYFQAEARRIGFVNRDENGEVVGYPFSKKQILASFSDESVHGWFRNEDNSIGINLACLSDPLKTARHELGHMLDSARRAQFREAMKREAISDARARALADGRTLSEDDEKKVLASAWPNHIEELAFRHVGEGQWRLSWLGKREPTVEPRMYYENQDHRTFLRDSLNQFVTERGARVSSSRDVETWLSERLSKVGDSAKVLVDEMGGTRRVAREMFGELQHFRVMLDQSATPHNCIEGNPDLRSWIKNGAESIVDARKHPEFLQIMAGYERVALGYAGGGHYVLSPNEVRQRIRAELVPDLKEQIREFRDYLIGICKKNGIPTERFERASISEILSGAATLDLAANSRIATDQFNKLSEAESALRSKLDNFRQAVKGANAAKDLVKTLDELDRVPPLADPFARAKLQPILSRQIEQLPRSTEPDARARLQSDLLNLPRASDIEVERIHRQVLKTLLERLDRNSESILQTLDVLGFAEEYGNLYSLLRLDPKRGGLRAGIEH